MADGFEERQLWQLTVLKNQQAPIYGFWTLDRKNRKPGEDRKDDVKFSVPQNLRM